MAAGSVSPGDQHPAYPDRRGGADAASGVGGQADSNTPGDDADYLQHRRLVFSLAYDVTGSVADAEDVAQGVYERWRRRGGSARDPRAWLARAATNLAIDKLRARREVPYPGQWLPEPIVADSNDQAVRADEVSMALLVVLETLTPLERAAFLLVDVFGFSTLETGEILQRAPDSVRQLLSRGRRRLAAAQPRRAVPTTEHRQVVERFLEASHRGDLAALSQLVGADVVLVSDGGGLVGAARRPVVGRDRVLRFLAGLAGQYAGHFTIAPRLVNGALGWVLWLDGSLDQVVAVTVEEGQITRIHLQRNPIKLAHARSVVGDTAAW